MARFYNPVPQFLDGAARVLPGAQIHFYFNNTTNPQNTFSDVGLTTPNPNPAVMGADGRPQHEIFMADNAIYSIVFEDSAGNQFAQVNDFTGADSTVSSAEVIAALAANTAAVVINGASLTVNANSTINGTLTTTGQVTLTVSGTSGFIKTSDNGEGLIGATAGGFFLFGGLVGGDTRPVTVGESSTPSVTLNGNIIPSGGSPLAGSFHKSGANILCNLDTGGFFFNNNTNASSLLSIDNSTGNVAVIANFDVASFNSSGGSQGARISDFGTFLTSTNTTSSNSRAIFYNPNGAVGSITTSGTATAYNTSSDPRLKTEFRPFDMAQAWQKFDDIYSASGIFGFKTDPDKEVWGLDAHKIIDAGLDIGTEGQGPRDLKIGDVYKKAVIKQRPKMVAELDEEGEPTGEMIEDGVEDYEAEPALIVTPAGVDQSKIVPYLLPLIQDLREGLEAANAKILDLEAKLP